MLAKFSTGLVVGNARGTRRFASRFAAAPGPLWGTQTGPAWRTQAGPSLSDFSSAVERMSVAEPILTALQLQTLSCQPCPRPIWFLGEQLDWAAINHQEPKRKL